ncbi:MAG: hypothetical protein ACYC0H_00200 [Solirubrobacteraceae bacterium]
MTRLALLGALLTFGLTFVAGARAGTYVIGDCPAAGSAVAGPWSVFGSPQGSKAECGGGPSAWIGPQGGSMAANTTAGVTVSVPAGSGITISGAKVWWQASHQLSGADAFGIAADSAGSIFESATPLTGTLPSTFDLGAATSLTLAEYCSNDDFGNGCVFGGGENELLELDGAQLTLSDTTLPSGTVTGGTLAGSGSMSGTASIGYQASDGSSGIRLVKLLVDGEPVTEREYAASCSYTTFLACPPTVSDTLGWNTASVADGPHRVELVVEDAASNTSVVYQGSIATDNAPKTSSVPTILAGETASVGVPLSGEPGSWSTPAGAGPISYAYGWERCDAEGGSCVLIGGAESSSYDPSPKDAGHTLRLIVTASDSDGAATARSAPTAVVAEGNSSKGAEPGPGTPPGKASGASGSSATGQSGVSERSSSTQTRSTSSSTNTSASTSTTASASTQQGGAPAVAMIRVGVKAKITRSFAKRALKLAGRLLAGGREPIAHATIAIMQQTAKGRPYKQLGTTRTGNGGAFVARVPPGPSRRIKLAYRGAAKNGYAATRKIRETVQAGVKLSIKPQHTTTAGRILLRGKVLGKVPRKGVVVELMVHYRGRWEPFRDPRTKADGRFQAAYQFEGSTGRFPFRAEVLARQAAFGYATGMSKVVDVATN